MPKSKLSTLVCKELADNALDICSDCEIKIAAEILQQNHYDAQVAEAVRQVKERCGDSQTRLAETVSTELKKEPVNRWKDVVEAVSEEMIKNCRF